MRTPTALVIIWYASLLHAIWAVLLSVSPLAAHSTPVSVVVTLLGGRWPAVAALAVSGLLAVLVTRARTGLAPLLLVPQQIMLLMSAAAGIYAAVMGHYADGVPRAWEFILGDQSPVILVAFLYTTALLAYRPVPR